MILTSGVEICGHLRTPIPELQLQNTKIFQINKFIPMDKGSILCKRENTSNLSGSPVAQRERLTLPWSRFLNPVSNSLCSCQRYRLKISK